MHQQSNTHTHTHNTHPPPHEFEEFPHYFSVVFSNAPRPGRPESQTVGVWCNLRTFSQLPMEQNLKILRNSRVLLGIQIEHPRLTPKTPDCKFYEGDMHGSHPPRANKEEWCIRRVTTALQGIVYAQFILSWDFHSAIHRRNALFLWFWGFGLQKFSPAALGKGRTKKTGGHELQ